MFKTPYHLFVHRHTLGCALLLVFFFLNCQGDPPVAAPAVRPHFAAIVVANLNNASDWYKSLLNLTVKTEMNDPGGAYNIIILTSAEFELELLQLTGSVPKNECLIGKPAGTEVQGLFKIGFDVADMNGWMAHVQSLSIPIPQVWTDSATGKRNFIIKDPEGNMVQFFER